MGERSASFNDDLSEIVGTLVHEQFEGGFWTVRFGGPTDPEGGVVVLGNPPQVRGCADGDVVRVRGRLLVGHVTFMMAGTPYEVASIERVDDGGADDRPVE